MAIDEAYLSKLAATQYSSAEKALIVEYVRTGNVKILPQLRKSKLSDSMWTYSLSEIMGQVTQWQTNELRMITALGACRGLDWFLQRIGYGLEKELPEVDTLGTILKQVAPEDHAAVGEKVFEEISHWVGTAGPNSAGRWMLGLPDSVLKSTVLQLSTNYRIHSMLEFLGQYGKPRLLKWLPDLLALKKIDESSVVFDALAHQGPEFERPLREHWRKMQDSQARFQAGVELSKVDPAQYARETYELAKRYLLSKKKSYHFSDLATWMIDGFWQDSRELLVNAMPNVIPMTGANQWDSDYQVSRVVEHAAEKAGVEAQPLFRAALELGLPETQKKVLERWSALGEKADCAALISAFERAFAEKDGKSVVKFIPIAVAWDPAAVEELLWGLTGHDSKPVRACAARSLARLGSRVEARALKLLAERKAGARHAGVILLTTLNTPVGLAALEVQLETETDADINDEILRGLEAAWEASGKSLSPADIQKRIDRNADKWKNPPAKWVQLKSLPALRYTDGSKVGADAMAYLLYRQSRAKEITVDLEAKPLFARIDRKASSDFGVAILEGFLKSKMDAADRWALTIAGLLGDDRVVRLLFPKIQEWAKASRGKLAEYAVQALALVGSDMALMAVDATAMRFRVKLKNIGKAATEAFSAAAQAAGLTPDELGDRVVPTLGFETNQPTVIEAGDSRIRISVGLDFKLQFRDEGKGKIIKTLPKSAIKPAQATWKEAAANLREVAKAQCLRLENLLVRQRRWPAADWHRLFLSHPVLRPFGVRLVWGVYAADGRLLHTFHALEDGSLSDAADEAVTLPKDALIGIAHPLELNAKATAAWKEHLADLEIEPPFPQMERPVVLVQPAQRDLKILEHVKGVELNAMTFKGRAERLGWNRGSVVDGGGITYYWKSFPTGMVDAFVGLDGMYVGIDMYSSITLGELMFVQGGSVKIGSYTYDEPGNDDPRLVTLGAVPPIVFSEVLGDLQKIAGKTGAERQGDGEV